MNFVLGNECTPCMSNTTSYLQAGHRIRLPPFLEFLIGSDLLSKIFWQQTWHKLWLHGKSTTGGFNLSRHSWQLVILSYLTSEKLYSKMTRLWPWVCISAWMTLVIRILRLFLDYATKSCFVIWWIIWNS